jgi:hypothetical protein
MAIDPAPDTPPEDGFTLLDALQQAAEDPAYAQALFAAAPGVRDFLEAVLSNGSPDGAGLGAAPAAPEQATPAASFDAGDADLKGDLLRMTGTSLASTAAQDAAPAKKALPLASVRAGARRQLERLLEECFDAGYDSRDGDVDPSVRVTFVSRLAGVIDADIFATADFARWLADDSEQVIAPDARGAAFVVQQHADALGADPARAFDYLRGPVAATVRHLEREGGTSRDLIADIIVPVLSALDGHHPRVPEVTLDVARYVMSARRALAADDHTTLLATANVLGTLTLRSAEQAAVAIEHRVLRDIWHTYHDAPESTPPPTVTLIGLISSQMRLVLAGLAPPEAEARAEEVFRDLGLVAVRLRAARGDGATTEAALAIAEELTLGAAPEGVSAGTVVAALVELGQVARGWRADDIDEARTEASSAAVVLAIGEGETASTRLHNAGISLVRSPQASTPALVRTRVVVNALGLLVALSPGDDPVTALQGRNGLNCATNLLAAAVDAGGRDTLPLEALTSVAVALAPMTHALELRRDPTIGVALARISAALAQLDVDARGASAFDPDGARTALLVLLEQLTGTDAPEAADRDDLALARYVAVVIRRTFEDSMASTGSQWSLPEAVTQVEGLGGPPVAAFYARYAALIDTDDPTSDDPGPLVAAGLATTLEWAQATSSLDQRVDRLGDRLRRLR